MVQREEVCPTGWNYDFTSHVFKKMYKMFSLLVQHKSRWLKQQSWKLLLLWWNIQLMVLLTTFVYDFLVTPVRIVLCTSKYRLKIRGQFVVWFWWLPAAKCRGVDLRPAMSFAFTFTASTSFFTLETSPLRQASNSSLKAPFAPPPLLLLLLPLPGSLLPESGVEPALVPLPSVVVGELALLLVLLLLLLRAGAGEVVVVGEAGVASPSAVFSILSPWESGVASSVGPGGQPGGVAGREEPRGGEDSKEFGCCCWEERRGVAIFTTQQSPLATQTLLTISCQGKSNFRSGLLGL